MKDQISERSRVMIDSRELIIQASKQQLKVDLTAALCDVEYNQLLKKGNMIEITGVLEECDKKTKSGKTSVYVDRILKANNIELLQN